MPRNMHFSKSHASSIDLCAHDLALFSQNRETSRFFVGGEDDLFEDVDVVAVTKPGKRPQVVHFFNHLSDFSPQLIVVHQHVDTAAQIAADFPDIPVVLHRHGRFVRSGTFKKWQYTRKFNRLAGVIWVGNHALKSFTVNFPGVTVPSLVVPNGIDTQRWKPAEEKHKTIVFVGRARGDKGVYDLAAAWKTCGEALAQNGWRMVFVLAVTNSEEASTYDALVERLEPIKTSVTFHLNLSAPDVRFHMAEAEIAVVPSIVAEGFGRTALEAMSCEAAVITTGSGGLAEAVGDTAFQVETESPKAIAHALRQLAENTDLRQSYAKAGRQRALDLFDIRKIAESYDEALVSLWDGYISGIHPGPSDWNQVF